MKRRGPPPDPNSGRQRRLRAIAERGGKAPGWQVKEEDAKRDLELLETIATLNGGLDEPARLADIAKEYGVTRQAIFAKVKRLRARGWLEENEGDRKVFGVRLTHNGKLLVETGWGAGLTE